eukprot:Polyplicarium_translucidae@DN47_c0_g1_i1.p1
MLFEEESPRSSGGSEEGVGRRLSDLSSAEPDGAGGDCSDGPNDPAEETAQNEAQVRVKKEPNQSGFGLHTFRGEDGGEDKIWDLFRILASRLRPLSARGDRSAFHGGHRVSNREAAAAEGLDELLRLYRDWLQEVYPRSTGLREFGDRVAGVSGKANFQAHRQELIARYKRGDWSAAQDEVEPGVADVGRPPPQAPDDDYEDDFFSQEPKATDSPRPRPLTDAQREAIAGRKAAFLA